MGIPRGVPRVGLMCASSVAIDRGPSQPADLYSDSPAVSAGHPLPTLPPPAHIASPCPPCLPTSAGCPGLRYYQPAELWLRELGLSRKAQGRTGGAVLSICWALLGFLPKVSWRFRTPRGRQNRSGKPQRKNRGLGAYVNRCLCASGTIPWRHRGEQGY